MEKCLGGYCNSNRNLIHGNSVKMVIVNSTFKKKFTQKREYEFKDIGVNRLYESTFDNNFNSFIPGGNKKVTHI